MTAETAQKIIGLSGLALFVLGPLSMILPMFFFTPLDRSSWLDSLGFGLLIGLIPVAFSLFLGWKGYLDVPQMVVGGGLLLVGTMTLTSGVSLIMNGLLDGSEAVRHRVKVERFWLDCSKHKAQNSTTTVTTCRHYGSFSFPNTERDMIVKIELPDEVTLKPGEVVDVEIRRGALGWQWGFDLAASNQVMERSTVSKEFAEETLGQSRGDITRFSLQNFSESSTASCAFGWRA